MRLDRAVNIDDLRRMARRRLPRIIFDFIEGGVEDESCLAENAAAYRRRKLLPRYCGTVSAPDRAAALFGTTYARPFGIAPTGLAGLFRLDADLILAREAAKARVPFILSTVSNASLEAVAEAAGGFAWFQLYGARDRAVSDDMVARARAAGIGTLVVSVDTPVSARRERNMRNGFSRPLRMRLPILLEALTHPGWIWDYLRSGGTPLFGNWAPYAPAGADADAVAAYSSTQTPFRQTWQDIARLRDMWPGTFVVKGLLHPGDAELACEAGADGIIVSNHGGRVLDRAPSPLDMFPAIREAVGNRCTLMIDSGITRGSDIAVALCMGARFAFVGRATLYGAVAGGAPGVARALSILDQELAACMGQIGCGSVAELGPGFLAPDRCDSGGEV